MSGLEVDGNTINANAVDAGAANTPKVGEVTLIFFLICQRDAVGADGAEVMDGAAAVGAAKNRYIYIYYIYPERVYILHCYLTSNIYIHP